MNQIKVERRIRSYQRPFHEYLTSTPGARAIEIAHRRWGKDEVALAASCELAHRRTASYWHCLPEYAQARKALWTAVNAHTGKRRILEAFPGPLIENMNEQEMFIRLKCGSTWQLIGSDRYDATVGAGPAGIVYSEWALANPSAWAYHRPMLEENNGWAAFITTPRGRNHAHAMYEMARASPRWFAEVSTVGDTGALTAEQLVEAKSEYIALYGEDVGLAQFEQEYNCSFNAAILGAFYAKEMLAVRREGRVSEIEAVPGRPVHTAWDIGRRDDTAVWWFQVVGAQLFILDCYSSPGAGPDHFDLVKARFAEHGWKKGIDFVPHDAKVEEWGTGRTRIETMRSHDLNPYLCADASKLDGINAVRLTLPRCVFHPRCEAVGMAALEMYRREWDDEKKTFGTSEVHDWTSHLSDAMRYLALSWRVIPEAVVERELAPPPGKVRPPPVPEPGRGSRIRI
jgi:hypothetical protein